MYYCWSISIKGDAIQTLLLLYCLSTCCLHFLASKSSHRSRTIFYLLILFLVSFWKRLWVEDRNGNYTLELPFLEIAQWFSLMVRGSLLLYGEAPNKRHFCITLLLLNWISCICFWLISCYISLCTNLRANCRNGPSHTSLNMGNNPGLQIGPSNCPLLALYGWNWYTGWQSGYYVCRIPSGMVKLIHQ